MNGVLVASFMLAHSTLQDAEVRNLLGFLKAKTAAATVEQRYANEPILALSPDNKMLAIVGERKLGEDERLSIRYSSGEWRSSSSPVGGVRTLNWKDDSSELFVTSESVSQIFDVSRLLEVYTIPAATKAAGWSSGIRWFVALSSDNEWVGKELIFGGNTRYVATSGARILGASADGSKIVLATQKLNRGGELLGHRIALVELSSRGSMTTQISLDYEPSELLASIEELRDEKEALVFVSAYGVEIGGAWLVRRAKGPASVVSCQELIKPHLPRNFRKFSYWFSCPASGKRVRYIAGTPVGEQAPSITVVVDLWQKTVLVSKLRIGTICTDSDGNVVAFTTFDGRHFALNIPRKDEMTR